MDESIDECKRLVMFEAKKTTKPGAATNEINEQFEKKFLKDPGVSTGAVYEIYASAAKELWKRYADKYELKPRKEQMVESNSIETENIWLELVLVKQLPCICTMNT